ncbi:hypothetical protein GEV33_008251 [Tenebrio molitor]|uniref:Uncharacterized protein n=1 Tax=Tenebrio molitor TaxID=7067 RepID=A0A8J6H9G4_TENMO|nr:hypothetical protein GEV33_008251 [Tenebrio molitor]
MVSQLPLLGEGLPAGLAHDIRGPPLGRGTVPLVAPQRSSRFERSATCTTILHAWSGSRSHADASRQMSMSRRGAEVPVTPASGVPARCTKGQSDRVGTPGKDVSTESTKKLKKLDELFAPGEK